MSKPRPDVSHLNLGYNYQQPASSYGVPSASRLGDGKIDLVVPSTLPTSPAFSFQTPIFGPTNFASFNYDSSAFLNPFASSTVSPLGVTGSSQVQFATSTVAPTVELKSGAAGAQLETSTLAPLLSSTVAPIDFSSVSPLAFGAVSSGFPGPAGAVQYSAVTPSAVDLSSFGGQFGSGFSSGLSSFNSFGSDASSLGSADASFGLGGSARFDSSSFGSAASSADNEVQVQKHLYFFSAPEEQVEVRQRVNIPKVSQQKNYKIIFIKAPTYVGQSRVQIPLPPQNEEKTIVYVLVKKPEDNIEVDVSQPPATPPSKPEVYFIKYKTQQEAEEAVANVQSGVGVEGGVSSSVSGVGSLEGRSFVPLVNSVGSTGVVSEVTTSAPVSSSSVSILSSGLEESSENSNLLDATVADNEETSVPVNIYSASVGVTSTVRPHDVYGPPSS